MKVTLFVTIMSHKLSVYGNGKRVRAGSIEGRSVVSVPS